MSLYRYSVRKLKKIREILNFTDFGGLEGTRTLDLSDANRTLSQTELQAHIFPIIPFFRLVLTYVLGSA